jgi:hypothetical protein
LDPPVRLPRTGIVLDLSDRRPTAPPGGNERGESVLSSPRHVLEFAKTASESALFITLFGVFTVKIPVPADLNVDWTQRDERAPTP